MSLLVGAASNAGGGYNLENSLRFRSSASAYLERTPATAGNLQTWTWSAWVKRGELGPSQNLFACDIPPDDENFHQISFNGTNQLDFLCYIGGAAGRLKTTQVFRDPSAWYHIVIVWDTTNATSTDRMRIYVNGDRITSFETTTYPSLNLNGIINSADVHTIGTLYYNLSNIQYLDGYLTEVNFVDGQALTASDFGETNEDTGVWQPAKYTGTYGTNGFYLPMNQTVETYSADYLVVAGGGGGSARLAGGGGAGGLLTGTTTLIGETVYTVTVGAGGAGGTGPIGVGGVGSSGGNSSALGITAFGGGGGAHYTAGSAVSGGSGGGGTYNGVSGAAGTAGQGSAGGNGNGNVSGAGGGGAGAVGGDAAATNAGGAGGAGLASSITGSSIYYAGGGGGAGSNVPGAGGIGGGGAGTGSDDTPAGSGSVNTGGGGGGTRSASDTIVTVGGAGGSGVVILRVPTTNYTGTVTGSPTVTTDGSDTVIQFTASGSYTA
jgi:hypothetical protein